MNVADIRTYNKNEVIMFSKTKEKFGGLSNMAGGYPLYINKIKILTSEALYQACRYPNDPTLQMNIVEELSPMSAKDLSRQFEHKSREDWLQIRHQIMRWSLRVKLAQNYDSFSQLLLSTKDLPIVELSYKDDFWGAKPLDNSSNMLEGRNVLGRLLMELREYLKADSEGKLNYVTPIKIPNFMIFGENIEIISKDKNKKENIQPQLF